MLGSIWPFLKDPANFTTFVAGASLSRRVRKDRSIGPGPRGISALHSEHLARERAAGWILPRGAFIPDLFKPLFLAVLVPGPLRSEVIVVDEAKDDLVHVTFVARWEVCRVQKSKGKFLTAVFNRSRL